MRLLLLFCLLTGTLSGLAQELNWIKFSDLNDSLKANPKKVIIKIETDWCSYCKMMNGTVFNTQKTINKIGDDYYFVRLNSESTEPIVFRNKEYMPAPSKRGKHELAIALNGEENQLVFPTIILLNSNLEIEKRLPGYLKRAHFFLWLAK